MMKNKVFINKDNFIEGVYVGDQNYNTLAELRPLYKKYAERLKSKGYLLKLIVDITKLGKTDSSSRKASLEVIDEVSFEKIAIFGGGIFERNLVKLIILAARKSLVMKIFKSRQDAEQWLKKD